MTRFWKKKIAAVSTLLLVFSSVGTSASIRAESGDYPPFETEVIVRTVNQFTDKEDVEAFVEQAERYGVDVISMNVKQDEDDEVARAAWRVAVRIVPQGSEAALLDVLVSQLGRGDLEVRKSLARALVDLAVICEEVVPILTETVRTGSREAAVHAHAVLCLVRDPGASFPALVEEARRRARSGSL